MSTILIIGFVCRHRLIHLSILLNFLFLSTSLVSQCPNLEVDAGPDQTFCDTNQLVQLMGNITGNYTSFFWNPPSELSNINILDPIVTNKFYGIHKFTLTATGVTANLIINGDFENGNSGFFSEYKFFTLPGKQPPGWYSVDNNIPPYHVPEWQWDCPDHTSGSGNKLIVNGYNDQCNRIFWGQTVSVKPNTDYVFTAYFATIYPNDPSNIQIKFNGSIKATLQLTTTLCDWIPVTFTWNSGGSTSLTINMIDLLCGNTVGNDLIVDDISLIGPCSKSDDVYITFIDLLAKIATVNKPKCAADTFTLTGTGSSTGMHIRYEWSTDIGTIISVNGLTAKAKGSGNYKLKVIYDDGNAICEKEVSLYIYVSDLEGIIEVDGSLNCKLDTVLLKAITSNGSGNFKYEWTPKNQIVSGQNTAVAGVILPGTYHLIITDKESDCAKFYDIKLDLNDKLEAMIESIGLANCKPDTVVLKTRVDNGTGFYEYEWTPANNILRGQNEATARVTEPGIYNVKIKDKNSGCEKELEIVVIPPDILQGVIMIEGMANCKGDSVVLKTIVNNGSGKYSYQWNPNDKILKGQNDATAYVKDPGLYKLIILDLETGCKIKLEDVVIGDTSNPVLIPSTDSLISCRNKQLILSGSPFNTSRYDYEWHLPDSTTIVDIDSIPIKDTGIYLLKVTDKMSKCFSQHLWNVKIDTLLPMLELGSDQQIDCIKNEFLILASLQNPGDTSHFYWTLPTGTLPVETILNNKIVNQAGKVILKLINVVNGCEISDTLLIEDIRNYPIADAGNGTILNCKLKEFILDGRRTDSIGTIITWSTSTGNIISGINTLNPVVNSSGWYYLIVEDSLNHCKSLDSVFIDQNIKTPAANPGVDQLFKCLDTTLILDGSNSTQGNQLKYYWYTINGLIGSPDVKQIIEIKSAGDYYLVVSDSISFCSDTGIVHVQRDINAPDAEVNVSGILSCINTEVLLSADIKSTTTNLKYFWTSPNGNFIQNPYSLIPRIYQPGTYVFTAEDTVNGCKTIITCEVKIDTVKPIASAGPDDVWNCKTNQLILDATSSTGNHTLQYQWSSTDGNIESGAQTSKLFIGGPGIYNLKVIDIVNGCESEDQLFVQKDLNAPNLIIQTPDTINCKTKSVIITAIGSSIGNRYNYEWSTLDGKINSPADQLQITVAKPGTYQLVITDTINKCSETRDVIVREDTLHPIINAGVPAVIYCDKPEVSLIGTISSPGNHSIKWTTASGIIKTPSDLLQIIASESGWYYLEVTNNSNGCRAIDSVEVLQINNLSIQADSNAELNCKIKEIALLVSVFHSNTNESILWTTKDGHISGNTNTKNILADRPGVYYVNVKIPGTNCMAIDSVIITENTNIPRSVDLLVEQPKCPGDSWQTKITNISGGENPLSVYLQNQLIKGLNINGTVPGNYSIKVIDKNGCEVSTTFNIITPQGVSIELIPLVELNIGDNYNLQPLYSIPDDSIASVEWYPADFLSCTVCLYPVIQNISHDIEYTVSYTNKKGCRATARIRIEILKRDIWFPNVFSGNDDNINDWFFPVVTDGSFNEIRSLKIFDRWGNLLFWKTHFQPNIPGEGWNGDCNGQHMNPDVYIYVAELEWKNGAVEIYHGDITLIR